MSLLAAAAVMASLAGAAPAAPLARLEDYRDRARVLVLCADRSDDPALARQRAALGPAASGLAERDLVTLTVVGTHVAASDGAHVSAERLRRAADLPRHSGFGAALIGKDGGVKLMRRTPIAPEALFAVIDAMPMRRDEMRR